MKMMHYEADRAVNLFPVPHIAGKREGLLWPADSPARCFQTVGIAGKQHNLRSVLSKKFCNRFTNAHRGASDDRYFPRK
jgi:hypothetical protein